MGEERAALFLARRGYRILDRNVRSGGVEIDLVASRASLVVFVEVKTRRSARYGSPLLAVDAAKRRRLAHAAAAWLRAHAGRRRGIRFDVIACCVEPGDVWRIEHVEGAFEAGD